MLAIPLFGDEVAPHFCSAEELLIVEINRNRVSSVRRLVIPEEFWLDRIRRLAKMGVDVLLCNGINRDFLTGANAFGIRVISGLIGEADRLIEAFRKDELEQYRFVSQGRDTVSVGETGGRP